MDNNKIAFKCPVCQDGNLYLPEFKKGIQQCDHCRTTFYFQKGNFQIHDKPEIIKYIPQWEFLKKRISVFITPGDWTKVSDGGFLDFESSRIDSLRQEQEKILKSTQIIITTTSNIEGAAIKQYKGIIGSQVMAGINIFKDAFAGLRNVIGGRSRKLQKSMNEMRIQALQELREEAYKINANAVVGVKLDFDEYAENMLMLSASGTAVIIE